MREAALYKDLSGYFDWWAHAIIQRAQQEFKAAPKLIDNDDLQKLLQVILAHVNAAALTGVQGGGDTLDDLFNFSMDWTGTNTNASRWASEHSGDLVRLIGKSTRDSINMAVQQYIDGQQDFGTLQRNLEQIIKSPERAAVIAQTEITRAFAKGNTLAWQDSGIVQGKQWVTNNDEIVCPRCNERDQRIVGIDENFGTNVFDEEETEPPDHPNCRCWVVPVSRMKRK
jgi:SPP1 gp7 family putative phage head morphogenesis protein